MDACCVGRLPGYRRLGSKRSRVCQCFFDFFQWETHRPVVFCSRSSLPPRRVVRRFVCQFCWHRPNPACLESTCTGRSRPDRLERAKRSTLLIGCVRSIGRSSERRGRRLYTVFVSHESRPRGPFKKKKKKQRGKETECA